MNIKEILQGISDSGWRWPITVMICIAILSVSGCCIMAFITEADRNKARYQYLSETNKVVFEKK